MIRLTFFILISFIPLCKTRAFTDQVEVTQYNNSFNKELLIVLNKKYEVNEVKITDYLYENAVNIPFKITLALVNDNFEMEDFSGSRHFLENELMNTPDLSIYLYPDSNQELKIYGFNNRVLPDAKFIMKIFRYFNVENKQIDMFPLYITEILKNPDIVKIYHNKNVPIVLLQGDIDIAELLSILDHSVSESTKQNFYLLTSVLGRNIYMGEKIILGTIATFFILSFILMTIFSKRILFHFRNNKKYVISLPIKLLAVFIFYYISTLVLEYIVNMSENPSFIYSYPKTIFLTKNILQYFIYSVCFHIIKDATFSKSPYLYSYISFFISMGIFIYICQIYLPLGMYQVWPMLMTMCFIISRKRSYKRFFMLLSPLVLLFIFIKYLSSDYKSFIDLFIISRYKGNLLLTLLASPYLFLQDSFHRFVTRRQNRVTIQKDIVSSILLFTLTITLFAILLELNQKI